MQAECNENRFTIADVQAIRHVETQNFASHGQHGQHWVMLNDWRRKILRLY